MLSSYVTYKQTAALAYLQAINTPDGSIQTDLWAVRQVCECC